MSDEPNEIVEAEEAEELKEEQVEEAEEKPKAKAPGWKKAKNLVEFGEAVEAMTDADRKKNEKALQEKGFELAQKERGQEND
jgi:hypothetical protein